MKQVIHNPADYTDSSTAWNAPSDLAPVGSNIMIKVPAGTLCFHESGLPGRVYVVPQVIQVTRTRHIEDRSRHMQYICLDGQVLTGRFDWTHA